MNTMRPAIRAFTTALLLCLTIALVACEKKDASFQTSPSAKSLLGSTSGNVVFATEEKAPAPVEGPSDWKFELGNARFQPLENGTHAVIVTSQLNSRAGPAMEIWLSDEETTLARWSGGIAHKYDGVICWQQKLEEGTESLQLDPAKKYTITVAFRDIASNEVVLARQTEIKGNVPVLKGTQPEVGSEVFRELLGCPRGT